MFTTAKLRYSIAFIILMALIGFFLAKSTMPQPEPPKQQAAALEPEPVVERDWGKLSTDKPRKRSFRQDDDALDQGAIPGQRVLKFASLDDLENFLKRAGDNIRVMDRIDGLNALRIAFLDPDALADLLDGTEQSGFIYPAYTPDPSGGTVQANAVPLGNKLLEWLGLDALDPTLGTGIRIAILDTGVVPHPAYGDVKNILLTAAADDFQDWNGHGTAAASLIIGNSLTVPGAAPGAELTSWRIADDSGSSDSWKIAAAIIQAVDAGNQIISISMGSYGNSSILYDAVMYAQGKGSMIVASSGNDGAGQSTYPAAYTGVISAVGVDKENNYLQFSNLSLENGLAAPGWEASSAWPGEKVARFSGTSAATPIISGAIASVMQRYNISNVQAYNVIVQYANEAGSTGYDPQTGSGAVNLGRIFRSSLPDVRDAAVASHVITPPGNGKAGQVEIVIQNQGTTTLSNIPVQVTTPAGQTPIIVNSLVPNQSKSFILPLPAASFKNDASVSVSSAISQQDNQAANNKRTTTYMPTVKDP